MLRHCARRLRRSRVTSVQQLNLAASPSQPHQQHTWSDGGHGAATTPWNAAVALIAVALTAALARAGSERKRAHCAYQRRIEDVYKLMEKPLGKGAFGVVCAGVHAETGEIVAIKHVPKRLMSWTRVKAEVDMLRVAANHKNVVGFKDFFVDDRGYWIVMDFATGGELFDRLIRRGAYSEADAARIIYDLADAIAYLHHNGICHLDVKPENILLAGPVPYAGKAYPDDKTAIEAAEAAAAAVAAGTADNLPVAAEKEDGEEVEDDEEAKIVLVDFGSAFMLDERMPGTARGRVHRDSGTVAYSPPEVLRGEPVDASADMWSIGVLLYILLSGMHPFDTEADADDEEVRRRVLSGAQPPFDNALWQKISPAPKRLIKKLLSHNPTERPTADELLQDPWLTGRAGLSTQPLLLASENLRRFHQGRLRLKACLLAVMAGIVDPDYFLVEGPEGIVGSRRSALRYMDQGSKGYLVPDDIAAVMRHLGENLSNLEVHDMLCSAFGDPKRHGADKVDYAHLLHLVPPLCPSLVYKKDDIIYFQGDSDPNLYVVGSGAVSLQFGGAEAAGGSGSGDAGSGNGSSAAEPQRRHHRRMMSRRRMSTAGPGGTAPVPAASTATAAASLPRRKTQASEALPRLPPAPLQETWKGSPVVIETLGRGAGFGELELLLCRADELESVSDAPGLPLPPVPRYYNSVCASEKCEVVAVARELFSHLNDEFPSVRNRLWARGQRRAAAAVAKLAAAGAVPSAAASAAAGEQLTLPAEGSGEMSAADLAEGIVAIVTRGEVAITAGVDAGASVMHGTGCLWSGGKALTPATGAAASGLRAGPSGAQVTLVAVRRLRGCPLVSPEAADVLLGAFRRREGKERDTDAL